MNMIHNLTTGILSTTKNIYLAGLGVAATVNDQAKSSFDTLVQKGEARSSRSHEDHKPRFTQKITDQVSQFAGKATSRVQDGLSSSLSRLGIPSRDEIKALTLSVEQLTEKVQTLQPGAVA